MNKVKYYDWNVTGQDYIVGDIHGCYDELYSLLNHIKFDFKNDRLFSVGDLVDRGPKSKQCLDLVYSKWFHPVLANHEDMMFRAILENSDAQFNSWLYNGGQWYFTLDDNAEFRQMLSDIRNKFPHVIVIGKDTDKRVNIVHAELYKAADDNFVDDTDIDNWNFLDYQEDNMLWGRNIAEHRVLFDAGSKYSNYGLSTTYAGHTPMVKPLEIFNHRFIDTAACYFHKQGYKDSALTICNLRTEEIFTYHCPTQEITESTWKVL